MARRLPPAVTQQIVSGIGLSPSSNQRRRRGVTTAGAG